MPERAFRMSRSLRALGHERRIIPAMYVKPFVKGQKNDYNDAEAIAEAALRLNSHLVREKTPSTSHIDDAPPKGSGLNSKIARATSNAPHVARTGRSR